MRHELLVVEADGVPRDASVHALLAADASFACRRVSWDAMGDQDWPRREARGVVAVAVPHTPTIAAALQRLHEQPISAPTFAVLPADAGEPLLRLVSTAVDDFMLVPVRAMELRHRLERVLGPAGSEREAVRNRLLEEMAMTQLVGEDPVFLKAIEQVPRFARSGMPVLITGETGTGKEMCARAIHHLSVRCNFPFIAVDCGALPDHLIENELFGHARGAYTDAHRDQGGLITMAEGGTLFLDEIDALSLAAQGKLLRFLQERSFRPLGSERFQQADVNVIAATNRDVEKCVREKQFRSDLYYRLNVLRLHLPPLRERRGDVGLLAAHFLDGSAAAMDAAPRSFSAAALRALTQYDWPGNVRELANVVRRAIVGCEGRQVLPCHVILPRVAVENGEAPAQFRTARAATVAAFERLYVEALLRKHKGNVTHAASEAHKDRRAFGRLIKKYGIDRRTV